VQKPYKGRPDHGYWETDSYGRDRAKADRYSGAPAGCIACETICKARERRSGEILIKAFVRNPRRGNPKGASCVIGAKSIDG
jgi:hypothetical protein